jgi:hypothetical protein
MSTDQIEIVLLVDRRAEEKIDGVPICVEGEPDSFAFAADADCVLIGAISLQSQRNDDASAGRPLQTQRGTRSSPCSFAEVVELFGSDVSKITAVRLTEGTISS